ncbi:hypothetical protein VTL71DRAFT_6244 [Oculimacula yallundae]|uniref:Protein kinase domain-containing protein n=1 Tax=Oculimacula yallundae TaxID=86028 RepID=A0ABR4BZX3_9HELO
MNLFSKSRNPKKEPARGVPPRYQEYQDPLNPMDAKRKVPAGWRAIWLPHDKQYSYLHEASEYAQFGFPSPETIAKYASTDDSNTSTTSLPSHIQSPSPSSLSTRDSRGFAPQLSPAYNHSPTIPPPPELQQPSILGSTTSDGSNGTPVEVGELNGTTVLARFNIPGNWSGKGQHVEFLRNEQIPLEEGRSLGRGASADVHEVLCRGINIARKQIFCSRRMKIEDVKRELEILRKLDHKHVVTLVGSYTQSRVLGLLLFPAAVCDLGVFLDELDEGQRTGEFMAGEALVHICEGLGIPPDGYHARERLNRVYGCLANAVQYLHDNDVRHKDLKPRNILLDRKNGLFVTDFGLSRDTTDASTSVTNGIERGTYKYCAPEVARYEPRGRAADIYSLGCVFLEINTVHRKLSLIEFDTFRTRNDDHSFQNSPEKLKEWMDKLREVPAILDLGIFDLMDLVEKMVADLPTDRPVISKVVSTLKAVGHATLFASCCDSDSMRPAHEELRQKYRKVKMLYFERGDALEQLTTSLSDEKRKVQDLDKKMIQEIDLRHKLESEMDSVKYTLKSQIEELQRRHKDDVDKGKFQLEKQLEELQRKHAYEIEEVNFRGLNELERSHRIEMDELSSQWQTRFEELQREHRDEMDKLKSARERGYAGEEPDRRYTLPGREGLAEKAAKLGIVTDLRD